MNRTLGHFLFVRLPFIGEDTFFYSEKWINECHALKNLSFFYRCSQLFFVLFCVLFFSNYLKSLIKAQYSGTSIYYGFCTSHCNDCTYPSFIGQIPNKNRLVNQRDYYVNFVSIKVMKLFISNVMICSDNLNSLGIHFIREYINRNSSAYFFISYIFLPKHI